MLPDGQVLVVHRPHVLLILVYKVVRAFTAEYDRQRKRLQPFRRARVPFSYQEGAVWLPRGENGCFLSLHFSVQPFWGGIWSSSRIGGNNRVNVGSAFDRSVQVSISSRAARGLDYHPVASSCRFGAAVAA